MRALVLEDKQTLTVNDVEKPSITEDQVLVKVSYCGVCGSDIERFNGKVHYVPIILGHEFSGAVAEIGSNVKKISVGQRVAVAPLVPCEQCENCLRGKHAHCKQYSFIGSRQDGALAEYVAVNEKNLLPIPDEVSLREAALLEPLTVAIHGIERVTFHAGAEVVVFGAGTIGIMTLLALKARGAGNITMIDINPAKLKMAEKLGATKTVNSLEVPLKEYYEENRKPEVVFETAGVSQTQVQSLEIVDSSGKIVYIGTASNPVEFPPKLFEQILRKEVELTGSWMSYTAPFPGYEWQAGLRYIKDKVIDVEPLITEIFSLDDKEKPFIRMQDKSNNAIKYLYEINK